VAEVLGNDTGETMRKKMRNGIAETVLIALIALTSTALTIVFEKETNNKITKIFYDSNNTECIKQIEIK